MNELSPIQQLDIVLQFLSTDRGYADLNYMLQRLEKDKKFAVKFDGDNTIRILNKLIKDGYVEFEDMNTGRDNIFTRQPDMIRKYWISFEDNLFITGGGYDKEHTRQLLQLKQDEQRLKQGQLQPCCYRKNIQQGRHKTQRSNII